MLRWFEHFAREGDETRRLLKSSAWKRQSDEAMYIRFASYMVDDRTRCVMMWDCVSSIWRRGWKEHARLARAMHSRWTARELVALHRAISHERLKRADNRECNLFEELNNFCENLRTSIWGNIISYREIDAWLNEIVEKNAFESLLRKYAWLWQNEIKPIFFLVF